MSASGLAGARVRPCDPRARLRSGAPGTRVRGGRSAAALLPPPVRTLFSQEASVPTGLCSVSLDV